MNDHPPIRKGHSICIICEGFEEFAYLQRLLELNVWHDVYRIKLVNAKGESKIFPKYQDIFSNNYHEVVLLFCDTDKAPYREYHSLKKKINEYHDKKNASGKMIIFANPCSMQIILLHFKEILLSTQGKKTNSNVIFDLTGVKDYDAHEEQIKAICNGLTRVNYEEMKRRAALIDHSDATSGSTNIARFIGFFENDSVKWMNDINDYLMNSEDEQ